MKRVIAIAAGTGFVIPMAWLAITWSFTLTGHESFISGEWFSTLVDIMCPPFFLQFTILAPFLHAALYAFAAYLVLLIVAPKRV
jgi:hypothetical protein